MSHEEGLSSDDEEPQSQQIADADVISGLSTAPYSYSTSSEECLSALDSVFIDARDEFSLLRKVLDRFAYFPPNSLMSSVLEWSIGSLSMGNRSRTPMCTFVYLNCVPLTFASNFLKRIF